MGLAVIYVKVAAPKDWTLFYDTGSLLVSGRTSELYPGVTPGYPFMYPPPFVWHVGWLGLLSPGAGHVALVVAMIVALGTALLILQCGLDDHGRPLDSWFFVVFSSASCFWMVTAGHIAAWFVLLTSASLLLWKRGREFAAGFVLGLIAIKPHYCIPILGCVVLARAWRVLSGAMAGLVFLVATTIPLGRGVWTSYLEHSFGAAGEIVSTIPAWKQITLLAFWRSVLGDGRPLFVLTATAISMIPCVVLVGLAWIRCQPHQESVPRLFALTVLMLVGCNVYSFHYDGLLLTIAGAVWFLRGREYTSSRRHLAIGVTVFCVYVVQYVQTLFADGGVALAGPLIAIWLIIDAYDLLRAPMSAGGTGFETAHTSDGSGARSACANPARAAPRVSA